MQDFIEKISGWLNSSAHIGFSLQAKLLYSILIIIVLYLTKIFVLAIINKKIDDIKSKYQARKILVYILVIMGIFLVGRFWLEGIESLATFLGLLSAGIAIALKDLITNMAAWIFILWKRPLKVGDRIQVRDFSGDVIDIRLFTFTLLEIGNWVDADQSTGRIINVPNSFVFTDTVANYHMGFPQIWNEIPVLVTFESDWQLAKKLLSEIAQKNCEHLTTSAEKKIKEAANSFMIFYTKLTPIVYTTVKDCGVLLTIRYLCEARNRRTSEEAVWEDILSEFSNHKNIDFAYPTTRFYDNRTEGKDAEGK